jgi:hypothetical protein
MSRQQSIMDQCDLLVPLRCTRAIFYIVILLARGDGQQQVRFAVILIRIIQSKF